MKLVITGTYKGIGREIAKYYLEKGNIVIGCSRHEKKIENKNYYHFFADVSKEDQVTAFAAAVRKEFGSVDVLINNAGIASMNHFLMTPMETAKRLMEVNYLGSLTCIRAFFNLLKKAEHPRIVNFSTVAVPLALEGELAYSSSKAAIENMTKILAKEIAKFHITVNAIGPSPIQTDLIAGVPKEKLDSILEKQAIHQYGKLKDVIHLINFLISPDSDFITGQVIYLGGVTK